MAMITEKVEQLNLQIACKALFKPISILEKKGKCLKAWI